VCKKITIESIIEEASWSGYAFTSVMSKLYPKELRVTRYKLRCKDITGKVVVLRSAMSGKKFQIIQDRLYYSKPTTCSVVYGKKTHIILFYEKKIEWCDVLNHKF